MRDKNSVKTLQNYLLQMGAVLPKFGADGDLGKETKEAIDSLDIPEYVKIALKEVGIKEIAGGLHSLRVLEYQATTSGKYTDDEMPWCSSFVSWVMKQAGISHNIKIPERAKEWANFGYKTDEPGLGSIAIKSRVGGGHVCIVVGQRADGKLYCVGGNQNNQVNIAVYAKEVIETFRNYEKGKKLSILNLGTNQKVSES